MQPDSDKRSGIDPLVQSRAIHVMQHRYAYHDIDDLTDDQSLRPGPREVVVTVCQTELFCVRSDM